MKKYFYIFCLCLLASCGGNNLGRKFDGFEKPNKDQALIYFYRPNKVFGSIVYYTVKEDNKPITVLYNGSYYPYYTTEGKKNFKAKTEATNSISLNVENGKTYFVRGTISFGVFVGHPKFEIVDDELEVLSEIKECKMSDLRN